MDYRGVFGAHVANLIRRLKRILAFYGASPRFVFCSATIANPVELANRLIDATPSLLTPAHRRDVAAFFRAHPVASGERALRQALERFDWYKSFRRTAVPPLRERLE